MADLKKKKQELAKLHNDAKQLYTDMEAHEELRTADNREKWSKMIDDGKAMRAELEQLEAMENLGEYTDEPAGGKSAGEGNPNPAGAGGGDGVFRSRCVRLTVRRSLNLINSRMPISIPARWATFLSAI